MRLILILSSTVFLYGCPFVEQDKLRCPDKLVPYGSYYTSSGSGSPVFHFKPTDISKLTEENIKKYRPYEADFDASYKYAQKLTFGCISPGGLKNLEANTEVYKELQKSMQDGKDEEGESKNEAKP